MDQRPFLAALIFAGALAGACTSDRAPTAPAAGTSVAGKPGSETPGSGKASGSGPKTRAPKNQDGTGSDNSDSAAGDRGNGAGGEQQKTVSARASASVTDAAGDREASGDTPDYVDILRADLQGQGHLLEIRTLVAGSLPSRMPDDDTVMGIETRVERGDKRYSIIVEGDHNGWRAFVSRNGKNRALRGLSIENDRVGVTVPWRMIGGAGRLSWGTHAGWTRTTLTETHYAFDAAPDHGAARYPGAR